MNQKCNHNEYETLDSDSMPCQLRYPLANVPGSELQNMNDQNVMNMSVGRAYNIAQQANVNEAVSTALSVTEATLSNTGTARSSVALAAKGIAAIFKILWKQRKQQTQWRQFMDAVEYLIDKNITIAVRSKAISELEGVEATLELYQEAAQDWNQNPSNAATQARVLSQFRITNSFMEYAMPSFRVLDFEVPLLTVYAQAANLHLLLLQDAVNFGKDWGMTPAEVVDFNTRFRRRTADYTDYCVNTYKVGLDKAVALKPNIKDYNKYPYLKGYTTSGSTTDFYIPVIHWNLMNDFRRDVTLMALDLVAIWPTYDIEKYTNPNGVNIQLSREVYSTAYGKVENKSQNWEVIERNFVRSPHLVTWLTNLAFYMSSNPGYFDLEQYAGIKSRLSLTGSNSTWEEGLSPVQAYSSIQNVTSNDIGGLRITTNEVTCAFDFKNPIGARIKAFGKCYESSFGGQYAYVHEASISPPSSSYPATHRLSYGNAMESKLASGTKGLKCVGLFGFGWLHNSLTPENTIVSDKTTQIPAVKGNAVDNGATVVRGPGSTGGDLVRLPAYNQQWTQLRVKVRPSATARTRGYKVRIRYASEGNANLFVGRYDDSYGWRENDNYPVERTFSGSMTYSAFTYLDTFNFSANEEEFKIELRCNSGGPIYIDKIEFIPEPEPPTPELPVTPGIYQIVTALNNSSVVDMDPSTKNVHLWQNGNAANQKWRFVYDSGQGAYQIKNIADENLVLTWQRSEGDNVRAVSNANRPEQYWIIQQSVVDTEYVFLQNKSNQTRVLDVSGSGTANGTNIGVYTNNGTTNKKFKLTRLS